MTTAPTSQHTRLTTGWRLVASAAIGGTAFAVWRWLWFVNPVYEDYLVWVVAAGVITAVITWRVPKPEFSDLGMIGRLGRLPLLAAAVVIVTGDAIRYGLPRLLWA